MLNKYYSSTSVFVYIQYESDHVFFFFQIHSRCRLIQKDYFRFQGQRSSQFNPFTLSIREYSNLLLSYRFHFEEIDNVLDDLSCLYLFFLRETEI